MNLKIAQLNINGRVIDEAKLVANEFNIFVNVRPNTEKEVPKVQNIFPDNFLKNRNQFNRGSGTSYMEPRLMAQTKEAR